MLGGGRVPVQIEPDWPSADWELLKQSDEYLEIHYICYSNLALIEVLIIKKLF